MAVDPVGQHAGERRQEKAGQLRGKCDDAEQRLGIGEAGDEPRHGRRLRPGADKGQRLPGEKQAEVAVGERPQDRPGGHGSLPAGQGAVCMVVGRRRAAGFSPSSFSHSPYDELGSTNQSLPQRADASSTRRARLALVTPVLTLNSSEKSRRLSPKYMSTRNRSAATARRRVLSVDGSLRRKMRSSIWSTLTPLCDRARTVASRYFVMRFEM